MTRDEVIEMARQAGLGWAEGLGGMPDFLEAFAALVAAREREECAKVSSQLAKEADGSIDYADACHDCAAAIRNRGNP